MADVASVVNSMTKVVNLESAEWGFRTKNVGLTRFTANFGTNRHLACVLRICVRRVVCGWNADQRINFFKTEWES